MFDIVGINCVIIDQFESNMDPGTYDFEIYTKQGTHLGATQTPGAWTLIGTVNNVVCTASGVPTPINLNIGVPINQGQTVAFYVTMSDGSTNVNYTNGTTVGNVLLSDANISVLEGTGKSYPFGTDFDPRQPNFVIHYTCTGCCTPPIMSQTNATCSGASDGTASAVGQSTSPWDYEWADENGNIIQSATGVNGPNTVNNLAAGNYTVSVTDGDGCTAIQVVAITEPQPTTANISGVDPSCSGASDGTATASGLAPGPWSYVWEDANNNVVSTGNNVNGPHTAMGLSVGDYFVTVTDFDGCNATANVTLVDPPPLGVTTTSEDVSCNAGSDGTATATGEGTAPWTYVWTDANGANAGVGNGVNGPHIATGLTAGVYDVSVTDANGCTASGQVTVAEPTAIAAIQSQTDNLCNGDANGSATVSGISGGVPGYTVEWDDVNNQTGNTATDLPAGLYTATITDANGCELEQTFIIDQPDPFILTTTPATDTCGKSLGSIGIAVQGGTPPYDYRWAHGDSLQIADSLLQGTYHVVISDINGCKDSTQATIGNIPAPKAAFIFVTDPEDIFEYGVEFTNHSSNASFYNWDFDDENYSDEEHPSHVYYDEGTYGVHLVSYNEYNCFDTIVGYVRIEPPFTMYVPTAFTPGKNGINDVFVPKGYGYDYDSFHMTIYDRWGTIVFQTNDIAQGWDGTSHTNGEWVPSGVYTYKISVKEPIGHEPKYFYGHVTMLKH